VKKVIPILMSIAAASILTVAHQAPQPGAGVSMPAGVAGHLTRRLFGAMVRRIEALPLPAG